MEIDKSSLRHSKTVDSQIIYQRLLRMTSYSGKVLLKGGEVADIPDFVSAVELEQHHGAEILEEGDDRIKGNNGAANQGKAKPAARSKGKESSKSDEVSSSVSEEKDSSSSSKKYWKTEG